MNKVLREWIDSHDSVKSAADSIGVSIYTIESWKWGKRDVSFKNAHKIARATDFKYNLKMLRPDFFKDECDNEK